MSGLCGWFITDGKGLSHVDAGCAGALPGLPGGDPETLTTRGGACNTRDGWVAGESGGVIVALAGHPRWRDPHLAALARDDSPAAALLEAYRRHQRGAFEHVGGDFSACVLDPDNRRLLVGIDRIGQFPMFFARIPGGVAFGTSAASVLAHPGMERRVTSNGLFHYLFFHMLPAPVSLYEGLEKLQGGQCLILEGDEPPRVKPYWQPVFQEPDGADAATLGQEMREHLEASVTRLSEEPHTGAFLSGGLDSSTVSGYLARLRPGEADTFSIGFDAPGYDEMEYARTASRHFNTRAHEYYVTPEDVVEAVPLIAAAYDEPFGNSSALPAYFCARMAADAGIKRMLAGDGGDELFAGNARYVKQDVFELWGRLPMPLRRSLLEPLFTRLPRGMPLLGKARSYVEQARIPLPDRLQTYNHLHRLNLADMFEPDFLGQVDPDAPWSLMRDIYQRPAEASTLNRMMYLDWQQTLADNDLRKVTRMCQMAGVDVVFPMLDDDLVAFSCRVPSEMKASKGRLRHFYKEATTGFLPDEIIHKKKHGFGLPFGVWMQDHPPLREMAYDGLLRFKGRGIMKPGFVDELIRLHQQHAAYYGEMIWILMMLDLWMETHTDICGSGPRPRKSS
ncbi:asparagine synthase C-terminal domain-containing protein [Ectothiorhodospira haloalkaliphila]|uniref:asparagine synthetase B family protein n=1 Tax=Ectothiorhodospira haloalkaliphila TaxID=421628 RepID=UPI001EE98A24|nr:asparagine synthase C-terminal domain-containing protein [Ectothiorhodospira haloalkaliphila]MCG5524346.1 asparagine synthase C-terminal domain-containing protein [Ectothiorhodospira haloalkaliphila]